GIATYHTLYVVACDFVLTRPNVRIARYPVEFLRKVAAQICKRPANHHVPARFERNRSHEIRRQEAEAVDEASKLIVSGVQKAGIQRTTGKQPSQTEPSGQVVAGEHAANHRFAVRLKRQTINGTIGALTGVK